MTRRTCNAGGAPDAALRRLVAAAVLFSAAAAPAQSRAAAAVIGSTEQLTCGAACVDRLRLVPGVPVNLWAADRQLRGRYVGWADDSAGGVLLVRPDRAADSLPIRVRLAQLQALEAGTTYARPYARDGALAGALSGAWVIVSYKLVVEPVLSLLANGRDLPFDRYDAAAVMVGTTAVGAFIGAVAGSRSVRWQLRYARE